MLSTADHIWIALSLIEHLGTKKIHALQEHFDGDLAAILQADDTELQRVRGIGPRLSAAVRAVNVDATSEAIAHWQSLGVGIFPFGAPDYPTTLTTISDPPATLFTLGEWQPNFTAAAIVGTRSPTRMAMDAASELAIGLAERGITVISGLALGIDSHAHLGAIAHQAGRTIGILGGGVLRIYPKANHALAQAVIRRGALTAEVPPFAEVSTSMLVARNRLISGLSQAVIIVETSLDGGAMHAARRAIDQGRIVFAVDLPASGNRWLLEHGARPISRTSLGDFSID